MDFNIFWMILFLLTGTRGFACQTSTHTTLVSNSTEMVNSTATPTVSNISDISPSNSAINSFTNTSSGVSVLEYLEEHKLYFATGGGCLLLIIIVLCIIVCHCRRSKVTLTKQLNKHKTTGCEEGNEILNVKALVDILVQKEKYMMRPSVVDNSGRMSNYDVILDICEEGRENDTVKSEYIVRFAAKVNGSDSSKVKGIITNSPKVENGNDKEEPSQKKTSDALQDNNGHLQKMKPFERYSSASETNKIGDEFLHGEENSEDVNETQAEGTYDILHKKPGRVNQSSYDRYDHLRLPNLSIFKKDDETQEAEVCKSDAYDHVSPRKRDPKNDYEYAEFMWEKSPGLLLENSPK